MFENLLNKKNLFKRPPQTIDRHLQTIQEIRSEAARLMEQPDQALAQQFRNLRFEAKAGATVKELLVPTFGLACACIERTTGMRPFPTQIWGGIELCHPCIVEMATGEGKTLTSLMPILLRSLDGKGLLVATSNDYLAARDAEHCQEVFNCLGITVDCIDSDDDDDQRRVAYRSDITYGTTSEFGFDFLRDRAKQKHAVLSGPSPDVQPVGRGVLNAIIVDEGDALLIDDAATPMVISSQRKQLPKFRIRLFKWGQQTARQAILGEHYTKNTLKNKIELTDQGRIWVRQMAQNLKVEKTSLLDLFEYVERAILVNNEYIRDKTFIVQNDEIIIVDENTGRLSHGREWNDGMQQAIQAKEGLEITGASGHLAKVTVQNFVRSFKHRSGLTGTAVQSAGEFKKIYKLKVKPIPTYRKCLRDHFPTLCFKTRNEAFAEVANEIRELRQHGRPVLIGTRTIAISEQLSAHLNQTGVEHTLLNAKNDELEADIISGAGGDGCVTIATNMAGRGTDIKLAPQAKEAGGLHVVVLGIHNSPRIDRQLIGRCARQGDPGSYCVVHFLDDDLLDFAWGPEEAAVHRQSCAAEFSAENCERLFLKAQRTITRRLESSRAAMLHQEKMAVKQLSNAGLDPVLDVPG